MVNIGHLSSETSALLPSLTQQLEQLAQQQVTSQQVVRLAEEMYWSLLEGSYCSDFSPAAIQLRETLSDITTQWESLLGNWHEQSHQPSPDLPEFPKEWVEQWLSQLQAVHLKQT